MRLGAKFDSKNPHLVFSHRPPPAGVPSRVRFVNDAIGPFVSRLREHPGKDIWLMGGGELIASFLDAQAIDEFVISVAPSVYWGGHPIDSAASSSRALGVAIRRTLRGWCGSTALPRSDSFLMMLQPTRTHVSLSFSSRLTPTLKLTNARTAPSARIAPALRVRSLTRALDRVGKDSGNLTSKTCFSYISPKE